MKSSTLTFIFVSICVYFTCTTTSVYGRANKCQGSWARHACFGGNGKRSSAPIEHDKEKPNARQYMLKKLLLPDSSDDYANNSPTLADDANSIYPDILGDFHRKSDFDRVQTILANLLTNSRFRDLIADKESVYKR